MLDKIAAEWSRVWRLQQTHGHALLLRSSEPAWAHTERAAHSHQGVQRHQHSLDDGSVIAVDSASEDGFAGQSGTGGGLQLPSFGTPLAGVLTAGQAVRLVAWPPTAADRVASRDMAPLLRPPAGMAIGA